MQITTWGNRHAANNGHLRDYAHKEWSGILKDLYYQRWKVYFDSMQQKLVGKSVSDIDFYVMEETWANASNVYPAAAMRLRIRLHKGYINPFLNNTYL